MTTVKIPQHRHCAICGMAVRVKEDTCSDECKAQLETAMKKKKQWLILFYISLFVMVVVLMFSLMGGGF